MPREMQLERFLLSDPAQKTAWEAFCATHADWEYADTLAAQQEEFFEITHPTLEPKTPSFQEALGTYLHDLPQMDAAVAHGVWMCYPWKKNAVRVLPEDAFFRVRTARNRNLIPEDAQKKFAAATVAIAGLSIGHTIATTLALSGGPNRFLLADHDTLALSNMNRIKTSTAHLGVPKTIITAQDILEINPYATVKIFTKGVQEETLEEFLSSEPIACVFDAVDDLRLKVRLREMAREKKVCVIMATCVGERILLDVERYDVMKERVLFTQPLPEDFLSWIDHPLSRTDWIKAATAIVGVADTPKEVADTNAAVGKTVTTRPLLGSTVFAMGAIVSRAVCRLVTQELNDGRYRFDLRCAFDTIEEL